jgi:hypothetical protein
VAEAYTATKTRSARPGWSVIFRHPLRRDARGKPGLKIRRGLNTTDDQEADKLVDQLKMLLSDPRWWSADRRADAERELIAAQIVSAFFDGIEAGHVDTAALREKHIHLPSRDEGYARVLLVGTTGAGKTTLLRHLIGSDHENDRFPSISTARTTISDMEIVTDAGRYKAAVTFVSEFEVRANIDECIEAGCLAVTEGQPDSKVAAALLTHHEQRFRLSYLLGDWTGEESSDDDDFAFDTSSPALSGNPDEGDKVSDEQRGKNAARVISYIARIRMLAAEIGERTAEDFGPLAEQKTPEDKAVWLELYSDRLFESEEFAKLSLDIRDDIESKFEILDPEELERSAPGWPAVWTFDTADRELFLRKVRWFSSNHHRQFGKLLTPLVDGIRVRGPFHPLLADLQVSDRLVLFDGQGLGHTAESASSVSTKITKRFADMDVVLLVDSAQQPMQAAPLALLRAAGSAGYAHKFAVAFTHFDQVRGDNLQTMTQKRNHLISSITSAVAGLRQVLGAPVASSLEKRLDENVFLLGGLDREIKDIPAGVIREMKRLLNQLQSAVAPLAPVEAAPIYTTSGLELALRDAVDSFLRPWEARLGLAYRDGIRAEHHNRVKALSRRFANAWSDEYDTLRPASDLVGRLQEEISRWLDSPAGWTRQPANDEERMAALNPVRNAVFSALHELVRTRLSDERRSNWLDAYTYSGRGSAVLRSGEIRRIYEDTAPPISSAMKPSARAFLAEVIGIVKSGVESSGGNFAVPKAA